MKIQKYRLITYASCFLVMTLVTACGSKVTSTPLPSLPTFAPPPTLTSTPSIELSPTPTASLIAVTETVQPLESTPGVPSETATEQPSPTASPTVVTPEVSSPCTPPNAIVGWANYRKYTIQVNDTLSSLARRTNATVDQIQQANCRNLSDTLIYAGQTLYLPFIPTPIVVADTIATPTAPPTGDPRIVVSPGSGSSNTIFTFEIRDYQPFMVVTVSIFDENGTVIVIFAVKMDAKGNLDVHWQSPKELLPGFYEVRPSKPDGTVGDIGTFVIGP